VLAPVALRGSRAFWPSSSRLHVQTLQRFVPTRGGIDYESFILAREGPPACASFLSVRPRQLTTRFAVQSIMRHTSIRRGTPSERAAGARLVARPLVSHLRRQAGRQWNADRVI